MTQLDRIEALLIAVCTHLNINGEKGLGDAKLEAARIVRDLDARRQKKKAIDRASNGE